MNFLVIYCPRVVRSGIATYRGFKCNSETLVLNNNLSNILLQKHSKNADRHICLKLLRFEKFSTHPGSPPASITLASVTSFDQTSYCHFLRPRTPHRTRPVCKPTRMLRLTSVASATDLKHKTTRKTKHKEAKS